MAASILVNTALFLTSRLAPGLCRFRHNIPAYRRSQPRGACARRTLSGADCRAGVRGRGFRSGRRLRTVRDVAQDIPAWPSSSAGRPGLLRHPACLPCKNTRTVWTRGAPASQVGSRTQTAVSSAPWSPEPQVLQGFSAESKAMVAAYQSERIRVPALASYAVPESAAELSDRGTTPPTRP